MVQRSSTHVISSKHGIPGLLNGTYEEDGPPLDDADLQLASLPVDLLAEFHVDATKKIAEADKEMLDGLESVGFKLNHYPGGLCACRRCGSIMSVVADHPIQSSSTSATVEGEQPFPFLTFALS